MADVQNGNGRNGGGNRIFSDKTIAYWLASLAATVFGGLMIWQLQMTLDIRERMVRLETVVFPPASYTSRTPSR